MGPVRLRWYLSKVLRRRVVIVSLLSLFCTAVVTNVYFISNMNAEFTSPKSKETLEQQWHRRGLIFSKEQVQKALTSAYQNATDWAEQEILQELKVLHPKYFKSDSSSLNFLEERIKLKSSNMKPGHPSEEEMKFAWSMARKWNGEEKNLTIISSILSVLCSAQIQHAEMSRSGTQLKVLLSLEGGQQALFKPQWYSRDEMIGGPVYAGRDRHNAEVAAFYLGLILDMNKVPYVVGRRVDLRREILPVADQGLVETFVQNSTHTCFYGNCLSCSPRFSVCGGKHAEAQPQPQPQHAARLEGDILEGALILMLPPYYHLKKFRHPWQRTYNNFSARWEVQVNYCDSVKQNKMYSPSGSGGSGSRLLDLVDAAIFDFLLDNGDRHHYEILRDSSIDTIDTIVLLDNGKGFGNPHRDHIDILAPLYQCCVLREKTYGTLMALRGNKLSKLMRKAQENSHISPLLTQGHLTALDRRLTLIFAAIQVCFRAYGERYVLIN